MCTSFFLLTLNTHANHMCMWLCAEYCEINTAVLSWTLRTVISSYDPDYSTLSLNYTTIVQRLQMRNTADPTVQTFTGTVQHTAPGTQRRPCADATKGNREHQTHLLKEHPHWRPGAATRPLRACSCVCVCALLVVMHEFVCDLIKPTLLDSVSPTEVSPRNNQLVQALTNSGTE